MTKPVSQQDFASYCKLVGVFGVFAAASIREPGCFEYDSGLAIDGTTNPVSAHDLASYCQINGLANSSPPTSDARGTAWSTTGRGCFKSDAGLATTHTPKFISSSDLAPYCGLVNWVAATRAGYSPPPADARGTSVQSATRSWDGHAGYAPPSADARGTTVQGNAREPGCFEYDGALSATGSSGGGVSKSRLVGGA